MSRRTAAGTSATCLILFALSACTEPINPPEGRSLGFSQGSLGQPRNVPTVPIDRPPQARPWDTSDVALVAAIAAEDGHASVAFKEPTSARALETGVRRAVTATTVAEAMTTLAGQGVQILHLNDAIGSVHVRMDAQVAPTLKQNPVIDYIEPRQWSRIAGVPGPRVAETSPAASMTQSTPWGIQMVRGPEAWAQATGAGVTIQLIDTGHDRGHEDLPLVPLANCAGTFGGCDDAFPIPHGSHVLGIWTARDNTLGVVGVAKGVQPSDVFAWGACGNDGACNVSQVTAGINAAIFNAKVINLSVGGPFDADQATAVAQAWANDIVLVAAAGNNQGNTVIYPAGHTNVLGVSGVRTDKTFASTSPCPFGGGTASSNSGSHVDLSAPFWALSTVPGGYGDETSTPPWCGTSMATPHVSGAAALVRAKHPSYTNQQVVNALTGTAEDHGATGRDDFFGFGIVNALAALGGDPLNIWIDGPGYILPGSFCMWSAQVSGGAPPYTYQWSGVLSGTDVIVSGRPSEGWLNLHVHSSDGQDRDYPLFITWDDNAEPCI